MHKSSYLNSENKHNIWGTLKQMPKHVMSGIAAVVVFTIFVIGSNIFIWDKFDEYHIDNIILGIPSALIILIFDFLVINLIIRDYKRWQYLRSDMKVETKWNTEKITGIVDTKSGDKPSMKSDVFTYSIVLDERLWKGGKEFFVDKDLYSKVEGTKYDWADKERKTEKKSKLGTKVELEYLTKTKLVTAWKLIS